MKHYTIKINNSKKNNGINFRNTNNPSKSLDDLILSNLIKMNPYLKNKYSDNTLDAMFDDAGFIRKNDDHIIISNRKSSNLLKGNFDTEFAKAAKFLSSYTPRTNKTYIIDSNDIAFFEDEIQIGYDLIPLYKLASPTYYKEFTPETKNIIINLFITING